MNILRMMMASMLTLILFATKAEAKTNVTTQAFGEMPDGSPVEIFALSDGPIEARIMTYGGIVVSLKGPDKKGKAADVVLGFDNLDGYVANNNNKGVASFSVVVRCAWRPSTFLTLRTTRELKPGQEFHSVTVYRFSSR